MKNITETIEVGVRFSDVDATQVVWHGNYLHYLEDAREEFCRRRGYDYHSMLDKGWIAPIVEMNLSYLYPAMMGERLKVEITYVPSKSAKLTFEYVIHDSQNHLVLTATSVQLFTDLEGKLVVNRPDFIDQLIAESVEP